MASLAFDYVSGAGAPTEAVEVRVLRGDNTRSEVLLEKSHPLFARAFPEFANIETPFKWLKRMRAANPTIQRIFVVAGKNLHDPKNAEVYGIAIGSYYTQQDVGLLLFNAVDESKRDLKIGRRLVEARSAAILAEAHRRGNPLRGLFLEVNNPFLTADKDCMDGELRIAKFNTMGARIVPFHYQTPINREGVVDGTMAVMAYPHPKHGHYPAPQDIAAYVDADWSRYAHINTADQPAYIRMQREIAAMPKNWAMASNESRLAELKLR